MGCWVVEPSLERPLAVADDSELRVQRHSGKGLMLLGIAVEAAPAVWTVVLPLGNTLVTVVAAEAAAPPLPAAFWMPELLLSSLFDLAEAKTPPTTPPAIARTSKTPPTIHHFFLLPLVFVAAAGAEPFSLPR